MNMGAVYLNQGDYRQALIYFQQALPLYQSLGDPAHEARCCYHCGVTCNHLYNRHEAISYLQQAITLYRRANERTRECDAMLALGYTQRQIGDQRSAFISYEQAYALAQQLNDPELLTIAAQAIEELHFTSNN